MRLTECNIRQFGCLRQKQIAFGPGINVIYGPNESGKTTLHTFLKSMLFGIRRLRGRAARTDCYSRYEPWENPGSFAGSIKFVCGERQFRLERIFQKDRASAFLICETDGERLSIGDGDLKMLLGGVSESIYENTVSIGQLRAAAGEELAMELKNYMANYQDSGAGDLDLEQAFLTLKKERKELQDQLREQEAIQEEKGRELQKQIERRREEADLLEEKYASQIQKIEEQKRRGGQETELSAPRPVWLIAAWTVALAAFGGAVVLEGWLQLLCVGLGILGASILSLVSAQEKKAYQRIRRREQQQKTARFRELDKLRFMAEHLKEEREEKQAEINNLQKEYQEFVEEKPDYEGIPKKLEALGLAERTMSQIAREMQGRMGGRLQQRTSQIFRELTDSKYQTVSMDDSLSLSVDTGERHVPIEQLSRGAMEQLYFALRLAAAEILCQEEPLPIVLDDVFAMYDEKRLAAALSWLASSGHQVLLCTCHTREQELLQSMGLPHHVILL